MQTLTWYTRRLKAMSLSEIVWRVRNQFNDRVDRYLLDRRVRAADELVRRRNRRAAGQAELTALAVGAWSGEVAEREAHWCERLVARATRIAERRIRLFDLDECALGAPADWNRDLKHGIAAPREYAPSIDYRDFRVTGDCKFVWEPNRHQHLVVLGRAYRATGNIAFAEAVVTQLREWLDACPFGIGMNWRSPLELAIRLINWAWAIDLIRSSGALDAELYDRVLASVHLHVGDITRKYSYGSSANNHRIGEAAGVFIATLYFRELPDADRWRKQSFEVLSAELHKQTYADGGNCEHALGYHFFVLQFFTLAVVAARRADMDFPNAFNDGLHRVYTFLAALAEGGEALPMYGDADDGYVLDLDDDPLNVRPWLALGAVFYGDAQLKREAGAYPELCQWLLPASAEQEFAALDDTRAGSALGAHAFRDSGLYLLQSGTRDALDRISVLIDCGQLGFRSIAAHGHADALSLVLRAFGHDVLVDPGTYDYFTYPAWRNYFRSTRAHNTVVVDGADQSEMLGAFLWGQRATARCLDWRPTDNGGAFYGEHDGYRRLTDPVVHRRRVELNGARRELHVEDELDGAGQHFAEVYFHLSEHCQIVQQKDTKLTLDTGRGEVTLELDPRLAVDVLAGSEDPIAGWVSRGYHRKAPSITIVGCMAHQGSLRLKHRIGVGLPRDGSLGSGNGNGRAVQCSALEGEGS